MTAHPYSNGTRFFLERIVQNWIRLSYLAIQYKHHINWPFSITVISTCSYAIINSINIQRRPIQRKVGKSNGATHDFFSSLVRRSVVAGVEFRVFLFPKNMFTIEEFHKRNLLAVFLLLVSAYNFNTVKSIQLNNQYSKGTLISPQHSVGIESSYVSVVLHLVDCRMTQLSSLTFKCCLFCLVFRFEIREKFNETITRSNCISYC